MPQQGTALSDRMCAAKRSPDLGAKLVAKTHPRGFA
jgi:hypothetical protein